MRWIVLITFSLFFFVSCSNKEKHLDKKKMEAVLWDIIKIDAFSQHLLAIDTIKRDTAKIFALQDKVFSLHGITRQEYFDSYKYYNAHPEYMRIILDSITTRAQSQRNFIMQKKYGKTAVK